MPEANATLQWILSAQNGCVDHIRAAPILQINKQLLRSGDSILLLQIRAAKHSPVAPGFLSYGLLIVLNSNQLLSFSLLLLIVLCSRDMGHLPDFSHMKLIYSKLFSHPGYLLIVLRLRSFPR